MTISAEHLFCRTPVDGSFFVCYISFNFSERLYSRINIKHRNKINRFCGQKCFTLDVMLVWLADTSKKMNTMIFNFEHVLEQYPKKSFTVRQSGQWLEHIPCLFISWSWGNITCHLSSLASLVWFLLTRFYLMLE